MQNWLTTFNALKSVYIDEAYSNIAINDAIEQQPSCSASFVRTFTKGVIRDTIVIDNYIDQLASKGINGIKNRTLIILRMGIYAIRSLDSVPDYAAVNMAVNLTNYVAKGNASFVNAILRSYIRQKDSLVTIHSFPDKLRNLITKQYGQEAENIMQSLDVPIPVSIRINRLKANNITFTSFDLNSQEFKDGLFSVQSISSIEAIESFNPREGSLVLDMCAAPGGKTCAMAEIMNNKGKIIACDIHEHRLDLINSQARRLGIDIIETIKLDGSIFNKNYQNMFDYVLADVPCSGLGVISSKPEIKLRTNPDEYDSLIEIQKKILENAIKYCKPGGYIEYSTCTINKDENDAVVNAVLDACNLAEIVEKKSILPYNEKIGFYYCILEKK